MTRRDALLLIAAVALLAAGTLAWGERIGVNNGTGWDGQAYVRWAHDFPGAMQRGFTVYQSKRVVPSAIVYGALRVLGGARSDRDAILGFQVLDALALVASAVWLARIARALAWSRAALWAAGALTFLGFYLARNALYYAALTDPFAFMLGMALVWAYLERRALACGVIAVLAGGTWPAVFPIALAAMVLPRPGALPAIEFRGRRAAALAVAVAAAAGATAWLVRYWRHPYPTMGKYVALAHGELIPVTIACTALVCGAAVHAIARQPRAWAVIPYLRSLAPRRTAIAAAAAIAIFAARERWVRDFGTAGPGITLDEFAGMAAAFHLRGPLWNLVHHVVWFGPVVVLAIVAWPRVAERVAAHGAVAIAAVALTIALSIDTESRVLAGLWPFVIVAVVDAIAWTARSAAIVAGLGFAWSKLWWHLGYDRAIDAFAWPNLRYTMHDGPRASDATFLAHGAAAAITGAVLVLALKSTIDSRGDRGYLQGRRPIDQDASHSSDGSREAGA
jgi:hypothetical protein